MSSAIYEVLSAYVPKEDILFREPMCRHTTFRVGGEAQCFVRISDREQLLKIIPYFQQVEIPFFILGNGSNLLVGDKGYRGVVLQISDRFNQISVEGERLLAQAGALLSQVSREAYKQELTGFEFASGIPGTIGGGVVMNAGAYDGEMKQVVERVTVMDRQGEILELSGDEMEFGYRTSIIKNRPFIVLEVCLRLKAGNGGEIQAKMEELSRKRKEKQPLEYASAGSTFKRPEGYFAGKLIMDAGLRGYSIGGACVSEKHCGFVVNKGKATAADVAEVILEVQERVKNRFGVTLEPEVVFLGDF
ncbi:MAG: UDP-N-acetylmuramate dehydrogenase [Lachnospiraceae bacterium]|nr:UDP-N-acetylmuramate dehydrogenase [Lachnospiraceae bacterium]